MLCLLSACVKQKEQDAALKNNTALQDKNIFSFTDDEGELISFNKPFSRIVSLYSAHTENLFAIGAGASVIGGHSTCDYPPPAKELPVYEYTGDPEYLIAAMPDLVLVRPFINRHNPAYIAELKKAGLTVCSLYPETFDDFDEYIRRLGLLTGIDTESALEEFHNDLQKINKASQNRTDRQRVFFESTGREVRTAAAGSLPYLAIETAGGINIAHNAKPLTPLSSIAPFGMEKVLSMAQDIDAYIVQAGAMNPISGIDELKKRGGYGAIKAVQKNRVLLIDEKIISSPTFRYKTAVEKIYNFLYPDTND